VNVNPVIIAWKIPLERERIRRVSERGLDTPWAWCCRSNVALARPAGMANRVVDAARTALISAPG